MAVRSSNAPPKPRRPTVGNHSGQLLTSREFDKMNLRQSLRYDRKVRKAARKYTKKRGAVTKGAGTRANQFAGADYRYTQERKARRQTKRTNRRARRDTKGRFR